MNEAHSLLNPHNHHHHGRRRCRRRCHNNDNNNNNDDADDEKIIKSHHNDEDPLIPTHTHTQTKKHVSFCCCLSFLKYKHKTLEI